MADFERVNRTIGKNNEWGAESELGRGVRQQSCRVGIR